jgi:hypothetical protein
MPPGTKPGQMPERHPIPGVRNLIAVASGKGGVGKTTVAVNLALALVKLGHKVGLLDADVYGPNVPIMLGSTTEPMAAGQQRITPVDAQGLKMISMGLLNPGDKPVIWRGPMLHSVITQFLRGVEWGELDYLVIDLPPGTGCGGDDAVDRGAGGRAQGHRNVPPGERGSAGRGGKYEHVQLPALRQTSGYFWSRRRIEDRCRIRRTAAG